MDQATISRPCVGLAAIQVERAKARLAIGFKSKSERDAYADYLQVPYSDLRRTIALHCERTGQRNCYEDGALPLHLGCVYERHISALNEAVHGAEQVAQLVSQLVALRKEIRSYCVR